MATVIVGGKYNLYAATLSTSAKTLTFTNVIGFDLEPASIQEVWDTTQSVNFTLGLNIISCALTYVTGLPVWIYLFTSLPAGVANGDTLVIRLQIPDTYLLYSIASYQASKV